MKKLFPVFTAILLILALCLTLAACGEKASDSKEKATEAVTEKPTDAPTEPPTEPPTKAWDPAVDGYRIDDGILKLKDVSSDLSAWYDGDYLDPNDNWVIVVFEVVDGHMNSLKDFLDNNVKVDGCEKVADSHSSKSGVYNGNAIVFFVAPDGYEFTEDKLHITEPERD